MEKKKYVISLVLLIFLVLITVGVSYAFFSYTKEGTTDNSIETGTIKFIYTEGNDVGNGITLRDSFPLADSEGIRLVGSDHVFDFNISSTISGRDNIPYEITARVSDDTTLDSNQVRIYLVKVNGSNETSVLLDDFGNLSNTTKTSDPKEFTLYRDTVYGSIEDYNQDYRLRIWVSDQDEFELKDMGKKFSITVNVYSKGEVVSEADYTIQSNARVTDTIINNKSVAVDNTDTKSDYYVDVTGKITSVPLVVNTESPNAKVEVENITDQVVSYNVTTSKVKRLSTAVTLDNLIRGDNYFRITVTSENRKSVNKYVVRVSLNKFNVEGTSLLAMANEDWLTTGYYTFNADGKAYKVHLYVIEGDQTWTTNQTFGTSEDCAKGTATTQMASSMVIVKVNGNLTINSGVTVGPKYHTSYGGPKGFMLFVTGNLVNNGIIDNSHGAYATGEEVRLWKSGTSYLSVPASGASGAAAFKAYGKPGNPGTAGTGRQTGGGGTGNCYPTDNGCGAGSAGTSYSGGSGGSSTGDWFGSDKSYYASSNGGAGGKSLVGGSMLGGGGAGNPGGSCSGTGCAGANGTGGLLVIYSNNYNNKGTVRANGSKGGAGDFGGGSSGGGSINIFYKTLTAKGTVSAAGGAANSKTGNTYLGGAGGAGTVSYNQISF